MEIYIWEGKAEVHCGNCGKIFVCEDGLALCKDCREKPIMTCAICGKNYKHRGDFLFATLCEDCTYEEGVKLAKGLQKMFPEGEYPILQMTKEEWKAKIKNRSRE